MAKKAIKIFMALFAVVVTMSVKSHAEQDLYRPVLELDLTVDEYRIQTFNRKTPYTFPAKDVRILRNGSVIFEKRDDFKHYIQDDHGSFPAHLIGKDINGDGKQNLVIYRYSYGMHCCTEALVIELEEDCPIIAAINGGNSVPKFKDLDGDGNLEVVLSAKGFGFFPGSWAGSPAPTVILRWNGTEYIADAKLMELSNPPDDQKLQEMAQSISQNPRWGKEYNAGNIPPELFRTALDLIYGGHEQKGWEFIQMAWKPEFPIDKPLLAELCQRLNGNEHYNELQRQRSSVNSACNNFPTEEPTALPKYEVSLDTVITDPDPIHHNSKPVIEVNNISALDQIAFAKPGTLEAIGVSLIGLVSFLVISGTLYFIYQRIQTVKVPAKVEPSPWDEFDQMKTEPLTPKEIEAAYPLQYPTDTSLGPDNTDIPDEGQFPAHKADHAVNLECKTITTNHKGFSHFNSWFWWENGHLWNEIEPDPEAAFAYVGGYLTVQNGHECGFHLLCHPTKGSFCGKVFTNTVFWVALNGNAGQNSLDPAQDFFIKIAKDEPGVKVVGDAGHEYG